ncbi:Alginate biosynthesis sensor protein KinB [Aquisphaera giovannonii]|uniref:histidine kinase n=1 Tax=Aquisphaera giovannonii TaxID=406548 RepID=A0A5B9WDV9_9BACT|nr:ATP-binding protein [Aquisphaera giovannonii]QEH38858.1 Alginate biosynthesis sensor protein KinB [Aquisphaera giovannonii]
MLKTLRSRFLLGIAPLMIVMIGMGLWAVVMFHRLGGNIDVILRENYVSVLAAQRMKEALERMDSAVLFAIGGQEERSRDQFAKWRPVFEQNLDIELHNITLPDEQGLADELAALYAIYGGQVERFYAIPAADVRGRTLYYFSDLWQTFNKIKDRADDVLTLNQRNMEDMNGRARSAAAHSVRWMVLLLCGSAATAGLIAMVLSRSLLEPIRSMTHAARAMARGDMEQVVPVLSRDELGELAGAFNIMARRIREFQQAGTARLLRVQKTAQATIDSFPDPVVVVDPTGAIERTNPAARRILGEASSDGSMLWPPSPTLRAPLADVLGGCGDYLPAGVENAICLRDGGQERFYLPRILAIQGEDGPLGAAVVLHDVTKFRLVDQLKSDMVATVSHELKTPLTSVQMAIHLLLEEAVGPLGPKQVELLLAARQDADRLMAMVGDLLDLTRIEQGKVQLELRPESPAGLVEAAVSRFEARAADAGTDLSGRAAPGLPPVLVDRGRIEHVFDNLLDNALAYTGRGGEVRLTAEAEPGGGSVRFAVEDTGAGIAPEHLPRLFERFYRPPGSRSGGAGLGLSIAREIVEGHRGRIEARSEPGRGTTFLVHLPQASVEAGPAQRAGVRS